jgi:hypothetical protein
VAPIAAKLRKHFASGLATDRADRPEWLFSTALKVFGCWVSMPIGRGGF